MELTTLDIIENFEEVYLEVYNDLLLNNRQQNFELVKNKIYKIIFKDNSIYETKAKNLIISLAILPIILIKEDIEDLKESYFIQDDIVDTKSINNCIQILIDEITEEYPEQIDLISDKISESITRLSDIAILVNQKVGNTISLYELIQISKKDEDLKNVLNFKLPEGIQYSDMEILISGNLKKLIEILKKHDGPYKRLLMSGEAFNLNQLGQCFSMIGSKPGLQSGTIMNHSINTSFLRGLECVDDYIVSASGARKALITSQKEVKSSGYLSRKLQLLVLDHFLIYEIDKCNTNFGIQVNIEDENVLKKIIGRYTLDDKVINENDKDLIGKTLELYSPITCNASNETYNLILTDERNLSNLSIEEIELIISNLFTKNTIYLDYLLDGNEYKYDSYILINTNYLHIFKEDNYPLDFESDSYVEIPNLKLDTKLTIYRKQKRIIKGCCKRCYGKLANKMKNYHAGLAGVTMLTNYITQILKDKGIFKRF